MPTDGVGSESISLLVVDDSVTLRRILRRVFDSMPFVRVVGEVADGRAALEKIQELQPDVVTLDVEMPGLDGLSVLRELAKRGLQSGIIMLSAFTRSGADATVEAMRLGAFDFVAKPEGHGGLDGSIDYLRRELAIRVRQCSAFQRARRARAGSSAPVQGAPGLASAPNPAVRTQPPLPQAPPPSPRSVVTCSASPIELVAIGASTGGPRALEVVLSSLGKEFPLPVLVVQHMPQGFTASLASSLGRSSGMDVREAAHGEQLAPGRVLVAPGGLHMKYARGPLGPMVVTSDSPPENGCRPAVDTLFRSLSLNLSGACIGVILTGMGSDGLLGCRLLKRKGAYIVTQDEASCVVYGMPRGPAEEGLSDAVAALDQVGPAVWEHVRLRRGK